MTIREFIDNTMSYEYQYNIYDFTNEIAFTLNKNFENPHELDKELEKYGEREIEQFLIAGMKAFIIYII